MAKRVKQLFEEDVSFKLSQAAIACAVYLPLLPATAFFGSGRAVDEALLTLDELTPASVPAEAPRKHQWRHMGVRGLWRILEPTARPVKLDTLRGKILAIDASIWIYHFLKAMRDPKGTILTAAHIIGFFRRICKLMFFEIQPVFVFDGAAPIQKKQTTNKRSERRLGREQNARATANKLLTLQLQRAAATEPLIPRDSSKKGPSQVEVVGSVPDSAVYFDELRHTRSTGDQGDLNVEQSTHQIARPTKPFVKTDQYHLPVVNGIGPLRSDDQRFLTQDELDEYSKQFTDQARAGFIDTSAIDFSSSEFQELPMETQYQLLNMARLKSRLRMGYSSEELNKMFPDEMEFSRFQINRVAQRNFFTQRLMRLSGMEEDLTRRVSSEKNKEYFLKRTDQGWSLALEGDDAAQDEVKDPDGEVKAPEGEAKAPEGEDSDLELEQVDLEDDAVVDRIGQDAQHDAQLETEEVRHSEASGNDKTHLQLGEEESAKLDELFGYEAQLSRRELYSKVLDEVVDEDPQDQKNSELQKSLLFDSASHTKAQTKSSKSKPRAKVSEISSERTPPKPQAPAVPWFTGNNEDFQEMKIREVPKANFVSIEEFDLANEDDSDDSAVELISQTATVSTSSQHDLAPSNSDETVNAAPMSTREQNTNNVPEVTAEEAKPESGEALGGSGDEQVEGSPDKPMDSTKSERGKDDAVRLLTEDLNSSEQAAPSSVHSDHEGSSLIRKGGDLTTTQSFEQVSDKVDQPVEEPQIHEEPRIHLSADAAERAEQEAEADKEEDEDIAGMLIAEAEENERFARELAEQTKKGWTSEDQREYETQITSLRKQFSKQTRDADNVSSDMIQECQELLQLFGIPYITAPTEAEAQCAELHQLKLVDGVVTDDGDTFLFDTDAVVYRNMFSQSKFVEFYSAEQIKNNLGLDRQRLIDLAFILGSDYTDGIMGIGPVTGVEILAEFGSLEHFATWWNHAQRFSETSESDSSLKRRLLRQFKSKLFLPENFPSTFIRDAYLNPSVDKDATKFNWGVPDLDGLRTFMASTAGWDVEKTNAALLPVVQEAKRRDLLKKTTDAHDQTSIEDFYRTVVQNPEMNSKRAFNAASTMRKRAKKSTGGAVGNS